MSKEETPKDSTEIYCKSIGKSISEIIRFSLDEEFRKSSFELFGVSSTKEIEEEISNKLMSLIKEEKTTSKKKRNNNKEKCKNLCQIKDQENLQQPEDSLCKNETSLSLKSGSDSNSQFISQNIFGKNWLQISSQQYREAIKRRKLNYYSQPQFSQTYQRDMEFSCTSKSQFSNSQPAFSASIHDPVFKNKRFI